MWCSYFDASARKGAPASPQEKSEDASELVRREPTTPERAPMPSLARIARFQPEEGELSVTW
jgi:hypothetical protein